MSSIFPPSNLSPSRRAARPKGVMNDGSSYWRRCGQPLSSTNPQAIGRLFSLYEPGFPYHQNISMPHHIKCPGILKNSTGGQLWRLGVHLYQRTTPCSAMHRSKLKYICLFVHSAAQCIPENQHVEHDNRKIMQVCEASSRKFQSIYRGLQK